MDCINYIQIHPTTLYSGKGGRSFLISESVRGEGAHLLDKNFKRFCDELQPRDKVTAEIRKQMQKDGTNHVWLDMRPIPAEEIKSHFPAIVKKCAEEGYDVFKECIPVVPAQHYFMGGIRSGLNGETTLARLYAVGKPVATAFTVQTDSLPTRFWKVLSLQSAQLWDIGAGYAAANREKAERTEVNLRDYEDTDKIFAEYKRMLLKAIKEADDARLNGN